MDVQKIVSSDAAGGEGPLWDWRSGKLWWLDISAREAHCYDEVTGRDELHPLPERISCLVPEGRDGFAGLCARGVTHLTPEENGFRSTLAVAVDDDTETVSNDGRCDRHGRFAVGMMHREYHPGRGAFYIASPDGGVSCFQTGLAIPNGADWSPDERTLYACDTPSKCVWAYEYDPDTGHVGARRTLAELAGPDGFAADEEGNLWVVRCGFGEIVCLDGRDGHVRETVKCPIPHVTSCAFGGEKLDTLFVTSANWNKPELRRNEPDAGSLYCVTGMPVRGVRANPFRG